MFQKKKKKGQHILSVWPIISRQDWAFSIHQIDFGVVELCIQRGRLGLQRFPKCL